MIRSFLPSFKALSKPSRVSKSSYSLEKQSLLKSKNIVKAFSTTSTLKNRTLSDKTVESIRQEYGEQIQEIFSRLGIGEGINFKDALMKSYEILSERAKNISQEKPSFSEPLAEDLYDLYTEAILQGEPNVFLYGIKLYTSILQKNPEIVEQWHNLFNKQPYKREVIESSLSQLPEVAQESICKLIDKYHFSVIEKLASAHVLTLLHKVSGTEYMIPVDATITTPYELTDVEKEQQMNTLMNTYPNRKFNFTFNVDPSLVQGLKMSMDGKELDWSWKSDMLNYKPSF